MAQEFEGVGDKGTGDITMVDTETLLENIQIYCRDLPLLMPKLPDVVLFSTSVEVSRSLKYQLPD